MPNNAIKINDKGAESWYKIILTTHTHIFSFLFYPLISNKKIHTKMDKITFNFPSQNLCKKPT